MSVPIRTQTVDVLKRLSSFQVRQDPDNTLAAVVESEEGFFFEGRWFPTDTDSREHMGDAAHHLLTRTPTSLGLTADVPLGGFIETVMNQVLSGALRFEFDVTLNAVHGGQPVPDASWTLRKTATDQVVAQGICGELTSVPVTYGGTLRIEAPGYVPFEQAGINVLGDDTVSIPLTPL